MAASKKKCNGVTCAFRNITVTTELEQCIGCGDDLVSGNPFADLFTNNKFGSLFGDVDVDGLFR